MYLPCISPPSFCFCSVPTAGKWDLNPHVAAVRYDLLRLSSPPKPKRSRRADRLPLSYLLFDNSRQVGANFSVVSITSRHDGTKCACRKCGTTCPTLCKYPVCNSRQVVGKLGSQKPDLLHRRNVSQVGSHDPYQTSRQFGTKLTRRKCCPV